ncbi:hypothetical protein CYLTODRAFT_418260 [Cylindrobasidium torrendii FP15055 ss-10]|uniref:ABM domain-containing protein n=1 Tax=Cylindrobasidium torrendii FP15055 ss-10 TaxID=1314674 RepID=A0A0D7BND2_9AGAR|nr:hypothetical protein CYLTODRAFT_418260 [Cylindrobasidium torrendii FP15055 ss-10]
MTSYCYEIAQWPASQAFQADQRIATAAFDIIQGVQQPLPLWNGLGKGEGQRKSFWGIVAWETSDEHKAFMESDKFPTLQRYLAPTFAQPDTGGGATYAHFSTDPASVFGQEDVLVAIATLKDGCSPLLGLVATSMQQSSDFEIAVANVEGNPKQFVIVQRAHDRDDGNVAYDVSSSPM